MRQIEYAVNCITRSLASVENDRFTPASISPETTQYVQDLVKKYPKDHSEFADFVTFLPYDSLTNELLGQVVSVSLRKTINALRREHDDLQISMETEIANHEFSNARRYLDRQEEIVKTIHEIIADEQLVVTPAHIQAAFQSR